jgi:hypothetical protein
MPHFRISQHYYGKRYKANKNPALNKDGVFIWNKESNRNPAAAGLIGIKQNYAAADPTTQIAGAIDRPICSCVWMLSAD